MSPEVQVEFCISGIKVSPEEITSLLEISPTRVWHIGDSIQETLLKRKHNGWCFSTNRKRDLGIEQSMKSLLQVLLPKSKVINHICNQYEAEAEFSCTIYIVDETPIITLDQDIIPKLAELNAAIDIDIILTE